MQQIINNIIASINDLSMYSPISQIKNFEVDQALFHYVSGTKLEGNDWNVTQKSGGIRIYYKVQSNDYGDLSVRVLCIDNTQVSVQFNNGVTTVRFFGYGDKVESTLSIITSYQKPERLKLAGRYEQTSWLQDKYLAKFMNKSLDNYIEYGIISVGVI